MLTIAEQKFLEQQHIPISLVFNATGKTKKQYYNEMAEHGSLIAAGTIPCQRGGHRLRTRHGHCVQCHTAYLAFVKRASEKAQLYIASSIKQKLIKVGSSKDAEKRLIWLNSNGYGGASDWRIIHKLNHEQAGRVELLTHSYLAKWKKQCSYIREGLQVDCREVFTADPATAIAALELACRMAMKR
jgi:hypothetical protein